MGYTIYDEIYEMLIGCSDKSIKEFEQTVKNIIKEVKNERKGL